MKLSPAASGRLRIFTRRLLCCHPLRGSGRLRRMSHRRSASASPHSPNATPSRRATGPPSLAATPVILLPRPRRRSVSFVGRDASQPPPPAPHVVPPVSCSQRHTAGQAPPPRALLSSSTHAHVAIEVIRGRERVHMEGQRDPTSPLFQARLRRLLETKVVSWRAKFALWRSDKEAAGDSLTWCRKSSYTRTEISYSFWLSYINASKKRCC
jgi:hypothetical protein